MNKIPIYTLTRTFCNQFPKRKDSIKKLKSKQYSDLAKDFKSYGNFVNYCNTQSISTKSNDRKELLIKIFEYQNIDMNDVDYSEKFWKINKENLKD